VGPRAGLDAMTRNVRDVAGNRTPVGQSLA
jgi:hypothetical protein